jgi:hypothetical protein
MLPAFVSRMLGEARSRVDETPNRLPIATSMIGITRPRTTFLFAHRIRRAGLAEGRCNHTLPPPQLW